MQPVEPGIRSCVGVTATVSTSFAATPTTTITVYGTHLPTETESTVETESTTTSKTRTITSVSTATATSSATAHGPFYIYVNSDFDAAPGGPDPSAERMYAAMFFTADSGGNVSSPVNFGTSSHSAAAEFFLDPEGHLGVVGGPIDAYVAYRDLESPDALILQSKADAALSGRQLLTCAVRPGGNDLVCNNPSDLWEADTWFSLGLEAFYGRHTDTSTGHRIQVVAAPVSQATTTQTFVPSTTLTVTHTYTITHNQPAAKATVVSQDPFYLRVFDGPNVGQYVGVTYRFSDGVPKFINQPDNSARFYFDGAGRVRPYGLPGQLVLIGTVTLSAPERNYPFTLQPDFALLWAEWDAPYCHFPPLSSELVGRLQYKSNARFKVADTLLLMQGTTFGIGPAGALEAGEAAIRVHAVPVV
ncbi:hypothetical protein GE09DRAFT_1217228 [Coniochaeta sp. 2T2.1]|nr:hypothetical protein GE09DRAFT_1217228 [Coniochaeta sp. 2T2.1]